MPFFHFQAQLGKMDIVLDYWDEGWEGGSFGGWMKKLEMDKGFKKEKLSNKV